MALSITFLGTGGSSGIPQIGCACDICVSSNPHNNRTRASICIHYNQHNIVIDTSPEFRIQMLKNGIRKLDAIIFTHAHADHIMGLADVRQYNFMQQGPVDMFGTSETLGRIRESFSFIFNAADEYKMYYPQLNPKEINGMMKICGLVFKPFTVYHAQMPVLAFRFGSTAYITDVNLIPEENYTLLNGLDLLILEAFRFQKHISHFSLDEAVEISERVGAKRTLLTHISHAFDHDKVNAMLPGGIELAYDGMTVSP